MLDGPQKLQHSAILSLHGQSAFINGELRRRWDSSYGLRAIDWRRGCGQLQRVLVLPIISRQNRFGLIGHGAGPLEARNGLIKSGEISHATTTCSCHNKEADVFAQVAHRSGSEIDRPALETQLYIFASIGPLLARFGSNCQPASTVANHSQRSPELRLEARVLLQFSEACSDIGFRHFLELVGAEGFARVAGGDAAVDDCLTEVFEGRLRFTLGAEPPGHAAEEAVACAGGVKDGVEGVGGAGEEVLGLFAKEVAAVFATLHDDETGPFGLQLATGFNEVGGLGEFFGLAVIDDEEVDLLHHVVQALVGDVDPEIHGIGDDEIGVGELLQSLELVVRAHVCQHGNLGGSSGGVKLWQPGLQDVDAHGVRGAVVHVFVVFTAPRKGGSAAALQAVEGDTFAAEQVQVSLWKVMPNDADEMDRLSEDAGSEGRIRCGATEQVFLRVLGGFDIVQGDGSGDGD